MDKTKPWYLSRTIWASLVTIAVAGAGAAGIAVDEADQTALADTLLQFIAAVAGLVAIAGRISARDRIG